ncbi:MAG: ergothioneine biosynthesis protein EgtB [Betaproteobacteria bacterium]|nr:ergothioneine biosynthesis protein EgtB [Betaproteobacteria bacterium]
MLGQARARTLSYARVLPANQWLGPYLAIVNPPLWEIGHVGWFHEYWCLRYRADGSVAPPMTEGVDVLYNSAIVPHAERWRLALPPPEATLAYLEKVQAAIFERLRREGPSEHMRYFVQLAVFHEDMHNEAFIYTLQTHGYESGEALTHVAPCVDEKLHGDAMIAGGRFMLGATPEVGFVFDNEKWAHEVEVKPFQMARTAVSNSQFAAFVRDGGYMRRELWCEAGWQWRKHAQADLPLYWKIETDQIFEKVNREWIALDPDAAVIHVNWYEAQAYCRWAERRLPSEMEWEFAASTAPGERTRKRRYPWGDAPPSTALANLFGGAGRTVSVHAHAAGDSAWDVRQMFGNTWEWTRDWFNPYPGFVCDPYKEYSEPWFGNHKVLRGGCYATSAGLLRNTWRNFYTPDRRDVLAGFRTCALD